MHIGAVGTSSCNSDIQVSNQITRPFHAKRIRNRRLDSRTSETIPTGVWRICDVVLLGVGVTVATTCRPLWPPNVAMKAVCKTVDVFRCHVDMCAVVLRTDGDRRRRFSAQRPCRPPWMARQSASDTQLA